MSQANPPIPITRGMFPAGRRGDYTYHLAVNTLRSEFPVAGAAQDVPVYGGDHVLEVDEVSWPLERLRAGLTERARSL